MTSVLFYPLCAGFPSIFITALVIGETGTNVVSAILSAAQVDGLKTGEVRFSVSVFFIVLACISLVSGVCSQLIYAAKKAYVPASPSPRNLPLIDNDYDDDSQSSAIDEYEPGHKVKTRPRKCCGIAPILWTMMLGQGLVSFIENGILASISANTMVPFGSECAILRHTTPHNCCCGSHKFWLLHL